MIKNYAILGTGAIGGYFAIKLFQAGFTVHCLLRRDFSHVKQHGLTLISDKEKITAPINAYQSIHDMPVCDTILVALKTTDNELLKDLLPKIMHSGTTVVILQNGIGIEQEIAEFIDPYKVIGGSCMLKVSRESSGVIRHFGLNSIELAQYYADAYQEGITDKVEELAENFRKARIPCIVTTHLATMRWKKLAGNIAVNGLSVVLNAYTQELVKHPASFRLLCAITKEVISAAEQSGAKLPKDFYQFRLNVLQSFSDMEKNYSSMKEDFDAKRPLELHAIYENAISLAERNNFSMPLTEMLYQQLLYLNEENLSKK